MLFNTVVTATRAIGHRSILTAQRPRDFAAGKRDRFRKLARDHGVDVDVEHARFERHVWLNPLQERPGILERRAAVRRIGLAVDGAARE
jgi:hypothetical protein